GVGAVGAPGRSHGTGRTRRRVHFYGCTTYWSRGKSICSNGLVIPASTAENGILAALDSELFDSRIVAQAMAKVRAALSGSTTNERPEAGGRELARVEAQLERLVDAVQLSGGEVAALVQRMRGLEQRRG